MSRNTGEVPNQAEWDRQMAIIDKVVFAMKRSREDFNFGFSTTGREQLRQAAQYWTRTQPDDVVQMLLRRWGIRTDTQSVEDGASTLFIIAFCSVLQETVKECCYRDEKLTLEALKLHLAFHDISTESGTVFFTPTEEDLNSEFIEWFNHLEWYVPE